MSPLNFFAVMVLSFALSTFVVTAPIVHEPELTGHEVFIANPSNYSFHASCGIGDVVSVNLSPKQELTIRYFYRCSGQKYFETITGNLDAATSQVRGVITSAAGGNIQEVTMRFLPSGEVEGAWGAGSGKLNIRLKE